MTTTTKKLGEREDDKPEIVFFDVETTIPTRSGQGYALLEFGAILVCPRKLLELDSYVTLIRPDDLSTINSLSVRCNGITRDGVSTAPSFHEVADRVYDILHGMDLVNWFYVLVDLRVCVLGFEWMV